MKQQIALNRESIVRSICPVLHKLEIPASSEG